MSTTRFVGAPLAAPADRPERRTQDLHKGRVHVPYARYFVTVCAKRPTAVLAAEGTARAVHAEILTIFAPPDARLLCFTIMPDHLHLLFELGERLSVGQLLGKLKSRTRKSVTWQRDFFEHRLRPDDVAGSYARYIFMNPYRAGITDRSSVWPWWYRQQDADFDFVQFLDAGRYPPIAWFDEPLSRTGLHAEDLGPD